MKSIALTLATVALMSFMANAQPMLNQAHKEIGMSCKDCHTSLPVKQRADDATCKDCHGLYRGKHFTVVDGNFEREINPHQSHYGDADIQRCTSCHAMHQPSRLSCNNCHQYDLKVK